MAAKGNDIKRLQKELAKTAKTADAPVSAALVDGNIFNWIGEIKGPSETAYEGGEFRVMIHIHQDYPYRPPKMRFLTKLWHPNISSKTGAICLDILGKEWSPALTIRTVLLSLQALLSSPEPDDPQDAVVAEMYKSDKKQFEETARLWTSLFAHGREETQDEKVTKVANFLNIDEGRARRALERYKWDEMSAISAIDFGEDQKPLPEEVVQKTRWQQSCCCTLQ